MQLGRANLRLEVSNNIQKLKIRDAILKILSEILLFWVGDRRVRTVIV